MGRRVERADCQGNAVEEHWKWEDQRSFKRNGYTSAGTRVSKDKPVGALPLS